MCNNSNSQMSLTGYCVSVTLICPFFMGIGRYKYLYFTDDKYIYGTLVTSPREHSLVKL